MVSFNDAVDSALKSEFEMTFDGYELLELYNLILSQPPKSLHLQVIARHMYDIFFGRVVRLSSLPFDDVEEDEVRSSPYPDDVPFPFEAKKYGK